MDLGITRRWNGLTRRSSKCSWPNPAASTGKLHCKMGRTKFCWEAVGKCRETFVQVSGLIRARLEDQRDPKVTCTVTWSIYMIGKTEETANPTIMFCSQELTSRVQVKKIIEESGILEDFPGLRVGDCNRPPDFDQLVPMAGGTLDAAGHITKLDTYKHGDLYSHPFHGSFFNSASGYSSYLQDPTLQRITNLEENKLHPEYNTENTNFSMQHQKATPGNSPISKFTPITQGFEHYSIHSDPSRLTCGSRIYVQQTSASPCSFATAGGVVRIGTQHFYLTVAHVFQESPDQLGLTSRHGTQELEFDIGADSSSEDEGIEFAQTTSMGSMSPEKSEYSSLDGIDSTWDTNLKSAYAPNTPGDPPSESGLSTSYIGKRRETVTTASQSSQQHPTTKKPGNAIRVGDLYYKSATLDYALVKLSDSSMESFNMFPSNDIMGSETMPIRQVAHSCPENRTIYAASSSQTLEGTISGTPTYVTLPGCQGHQELWTVSLNGTLESGDCGSWVIDAKSGDLLGHIVSGSPNTGVAYVLPTHLVFVDFKEQTRVALELVQGGREGQDIAEMENRSQLGLTMDLNINPDGYQQRSTPSSLSWPQDSPLLQLYKFVCRKNEEPYFELLPEWSATHVTPSEVYLDRPSHPRRGIYPCMYPGACGRLFTRKADLSRHFKNVHGTREDKELFTCDYRKCDRSKSGYKFTRKDHLRDHLKEYHKEDLGHAKSTRNRKELLGNERRRLEAEWQDERRIDPSWWRCPKCLIRISVDKKGWVCETCKLPCNQERITARQEKSLKANNVEEYGTTTAEQGAYSYEGPCSACSGSGYIDEGQDSRGACPSCWSAATHCDDSTGKGNVYETSYTIG